MFKSIAVLALAGSAMARPALEARKLRTVVHTVVVTKTDFVTYTGVPQSSSAAPAYSAVAQAVQPVPSQKKEEYVVVKPTPSPKPSSQAPPAYSAAPQPSAPAPAPQPSSQAPPAYSAAPRPSPTPAPAPKPSPAPAPAPKPSPAPAPPANSGYMAVVDEYRQKLGLSDLAFDSTLEANAADAAKAGNGQMVHKLNSGSMAQVLAPASMADFKKAFVGGWLCERPNLAGISDECGAASQGWIHDSTGHVDILTSKAYKKIGCASVGGILCCDLA